LAGFIVGMAGVRGKKSPVGRSFFWGSTKDGLRNLGDKEIGRSWAVAPKEP